MLTYYLISALIGIAVACAEILSRYKDEPLKTLVYGWSVAYVLLNGLISAAAFAIIVTAGEASETVADIENLKYAAYAGFGAALVMRAKLLNLKINSGEQVSIGPDFVIDTLLRVLDRQTDRKRAYKRAKLVMEKMTNVDFDRAQTTLITLLIRSMQGISDSEQKVIGMKVAEIGVSDELSNQDMAYALGFILLDYGGEKLFVELLSKDEIKKLLVE